MRMENMMGARLLLAYDQADEFKMCSTQGIIKTLRFFISFFFWLSEEASFI
jgi:hypothetical protein